MVPTVNCGGNLPFSTAIAKRCATIDKRSYCAKQPRGGGMTQVHRNGVLAGQVAVVTGPSRGISRSIISCSIGEAIAKRYATPVKHMAEACLRLCHGDSGTITGRIDYADQVIEEFQLQPANIF